MVKIRFTASFQADLDEIAGYYVWDSPTQVEVDAALRARDSQHFILNGQKPNKKGEFEQYHPADLDKVSTNYYQIRGREQELIDFHGGARSKGGTSRNSIRGYSRNNPRRFIYKTAAALKGWLLPSNNPAD